MQRTVTIGFGLRYGTDGPDLARAEVQDVRSSIVETLRLIGADLHTVAQGTGYFDGQQEPTVCVVATVKLELNEHDQDDYDISLTVCHDHDVHQTAYRLPTPLLGVLERLRDAYGQECVAVTVGETVFI